jgi:hypothetical protein
MGYTAAQPARRRVPTVVVHLATDDGDVIFRARWKERAIDLQRRIVFRIRAGMPLWFEDDAGHDLCFKPERVWRAVVAEPR